MSALFVLLSLVVSLFGFAGGGGSSSDFGGGSSSSFSDSGWSSDSGGGGGGSGTSSPEAAWIAMIMYVIIFASIILMAKKGRIKSTQQNASALSAAERGQIIAALSSTNYNETEQEKWIHKEAKLIFVNYQNDWSNYAIQNIRRYTTDAYFQHAQLMLEAIDEVGRRNVVKDLKVNEVRLLTEVNDETTLPTKVLVLYRFSGLDSIVDTHTEEIYYKDRVSGAVEFWHFIYDGHSLKLDKIGQTTESQSHLVQEMSDFAKTNHMYYSPDWGRMALPTDGVIFSEDALSRADVNNHIIGKWGDCLIQMYTYAPIASSPDEYYLVGQINVPKSYEGVIIQAKKSKIKIMKPLGYESFEMEWAEFNQRYQVYAANKDALPVFELLNPAFMEKLYERNLPYNIEVKGNTICIFAGIDETKESDYVELSEVLADAFGELKR